MLPTPIRKAVFPHGMNQVSPVVDEISLKHLAKWNTRSNSLPLKTVSFDCPHILGKNIDQHFLAIGAAGVQHYITALFDFLHSVPIASDLLITYAHDLGSVATVIRTYGIDHKEAIARLHALGNYDITLPKWRFTPGWTHYPFLGNAVSKAPSGVFVFDVEVCVKLSRFPILATAFSKEGWFLWVSPWLFGGSEKQLISLENGGLVIGHNVCYDRASVLQEYNLAASNLNFLDTMSLHIATNGMASGQRMLFNKSTSDVEHAEWIRTTCGNSLADLARFYTETNLPKDLRNVFVECTDLNEIKDKFQELASYCARDSESTFRVLRQLFPAFLHKCPHPASLSAILKMGSCYLPVDASWNSFISNCTDRVNKLYTQVETNLILLAHKSILKCYNLKNARTHDNSPLNLNNLNEFPLSKVLSNTISLNMDIIKASPWLCHLDWTIKPLKLTKCGRPHVHSKLANYPKWLRDLYLTKENRLVITHKKNVAPALLEMTWEGKPIVFSKQHKWCFLSKTNSPIQLDDQLDQLNFEHYLNKGFHLCKLPHKDGEDKNLGSPFVKHNLEHFESGKIDSNEPTAKLALQTQIESSYWVNAQERITNQFVVWQRDFPQINMSGINRGAIIPQMAVMGTVTRRAVDATWLTASNSRTNRIGSDLKRFLVPPEGYSIVGADVDSEELWICGILGDSQLGTHGSTALGWMNLQGAKSDGTDMHSITGKILGISRDQAKQFNYARIYGAGQRFAQTLLLQNADITVEEAKRKTNDLYRETKGLRFKVKTSSGRTDIWAGGRESYMFNSIEEIATSPDPRTPALHCQIPEPLMPHRCGGFMTSRVNWTVQSSGVDYLHLLVVSMDYLINKYTIDARLMITIHDEIRYIVKDCDKYRAALALQISHLWARCLFSYKLGMHDLPFKVAFFSEVDIDHCLRKDANDPCITPTNSVPVKAAETMSIYNLLNRVESLGEGKPDSIDIPNLIFKTHTQQRNLPHLVLQMSSSRAEYLESLVWLDNLRVPNERITIKH